MNAPNASSHHGFAHAPATLRLGDLEVQRLGFGAMRLPGREVWGEPEHPDRVRAVLRRVVELGINLIDTAWYYGPYVSNRLIAETLHPYPKGLVIATKLGGKRLPDKSWAPALRPEELRKGCEDDLRTLRLDVLDVVHFRYLENEVPFTESLDALIALKKEGKIRHLGVSNVTSAQLATALERTPVVSVQNLYNAGGGLGSLMPAGMEPPESPEVVLAACEKRGIAFMPYFPLAMGHLGKASRLAAVAERHRVTPAQVSIAWLLARSPVMLPIPGTSSPEHLDENWASRSIALGREELEAIAQEARQSLTKA